MVIKNWKKHWENKDKDWITYKGSYGRELDVLYNKRSKRWDVIPEKSLTGAKIFKTKSQALKYAKSYMRTH